MTAGDLTPGDDADDATPEPPGSLYLFVNTPVHIVWRTKDGAIVGRQWIEMKAKETP